MTEEFISEETKEKLGVFAHRCWSDIRSEWFKLSDLIDEVDKLVDRYDHMFAMYWDDEEKTISVDEVMNMEGMRINDIHDITNSLIDIADRFIDLRQKHEKDVEDILNE